MVILEVTLQDPFQVVLIENDHVVQIIAADTADAPLDVRILPRAPGCCDHFFDEETVHTAVKTLAIDRISVTKRVARCGIPGEGFDHLLCDPLGRRVLRDIKVENLTTLVSQHDKDV